MSEAAESDHKAAICTRNALRETRVAKAISEAPESVKNTLREAFSGSASPRRAIRAMCLTCVGYDRKEVRDCSAYACPLWAYRPFQDPE